MDIWSWSQPLGLGAFIVAIALSITLLSLAGKFGAHAATTRRPRR
jgi:hypothetical protein